MPQDSWVTGSMRKGTSHSGRLAGSSSATPCYLVAKFERGRRYSEPEVNEILDTWAPFRDAALLRRTMIEEHLLERTPDGREYWVA
jgi:hypothetical protein